MRPPRIPLLRVCRYVERNPLSAGLVKRAEQWRWGSLWVRGNGTEPQKQMLCPWPVPRPPDWTGRVNAALSQKEQSRWELSLSRSRPFGDDAWTTSTVKQMGLEHTVRGEGGDQYGRRAEKP